MALPSTSAPARRDTQVLCLDPTASLRSPLRQAFRVAISIELQVLRRRGARVRHIGPDTEAAEAMGTEAVHRALVRFELGEEAQPAEVDSQHGNALGRRQPPAREKGTVTAKSHDQHRVRKTCRYGFDRTVTLRLPSLDTA